MVDTSQHPEGEGPPWLQSPKLPERPHHQRAVSETAASTAGMEAALAADPTTGLGR
jgi:hypothetical protein